MGCEFRVKHSQGADAGKHVPCGKPSAPRRCEGFASAIIMELCDGHAAFCERVYHWTVKPYSLRDFEVDLPQATDTTEE